MITVKGVLDALLLAGYCQRDKPGSIFACRTDASVLRDKPVQNLEGEHRELRHPSRGDEAGHIVIYCDLQPPYVFAQVLDVWVRYYDL